MNRIRGRIIALILGLGLSLLLAEAVLLILGQPRFYKRHSFPPQFALLTDRNDDFLIVNIPSSAIRFVYESNPRGYFDKDNAVEHITNSSGFRGKEFSSDKPEGTLRIAFLGDSFTLGEGVKIILAKSPNNQMQVIWHDTETIEAAVKYKLKVFYGNQKNLTFLGFLKYSESFVGNCGQKIGRILFIEPFYMSHS